MLNTENETVRILSNTENIIMRLHQLQRTKLCISPNTEKVRTFPSDFYTGQSLNTDNQSNWFCRVRRENHADFNSAEFSLAFEYLSKCESIFGTALGQELWCHVGCFVETSSQPKVSCKCTLTVSHTYRQHILILFEFIVHVVHQFHTFKHPAVHILASTVYKYTMSRRH
jgi:hypothetical protein